MFGKWVGSSIQPIMNSIGIEVSALDKIKNSKFKSVKNLIANISFISTVVSKLRVLLSFINYVIIVCC